MPETPHDPPPQCHVHDQVREWELGEIRQFVCSQGTDLTQFEERNFYCAFHLPTQKKDIALFKRLLKSKIESIEARIDDAQKNSGRDRKLERNLQAVIDLEDGSNRSAVPIITDVDEEADLENNITFDFRYVWFPAEITFFKNYYFRTPVNFSYARFFGEADFGTAKFKDDANFASAHFHSSANFQTAIFFKGAEFDRALFESHVDFVHAFFTQAAYFKYCRFKSKTDFSSVHFDSDAFFDSVTIYESSQLLFVATSIQGRFHLKNALVQGYVHFEAGEGRFFNGDWRDTGKTQPKLKSRKTHVFEGALNLANVRVENSERILFHRVRSCPGWFVNVDSRSMVFTDVNWDNLDQVSWKTVFANFSLNTLIRKFQNPNIAAEIESLKKREIDKPSRLLEIAARQLGENAEQNNRYEDASKFRYMAMEAKRLEYAWHGRLWTLSWWYRLSSGYGENWRRAALVLLFIWLGFGLFYWQFGSFQIETPLDVWQSLGYSSQVMLLQKPNPRPLSNLTFTMYVLETIFAPLQAALLALAIRRKFMR